MPKTFIIDGEKFNDYKGFCKEFSDEVLSGKYIWQGNLDAFNDILFGGFGDIETGECYRIIWRNSIKSKQNLGYHERIKKLESIIESCHPSNISRLREEINIASKGAGPTLFDELIEIISDHENINLILE